MTLHAAPRRVADSPGRAESDPGLQSLRSRLGCRPARPPPSCLQAGCCVRRSRRGRAWFRSGRPTHGRPVASGRLSPRTWSRSGWTGTTGRPSPQSGRTALPSLPAAGQASPTQRRARTSPASCGPVRICEIFDVDRLVVADQPSVRRQPVRADPELRQGSGVQGRAAARTYYGIGHDSLDNYIAQISGQAPNVQTGQDCEYFSKFLPVRRGELRQVDQGTASCPGTAASTRSTCGTVGSQLSRARPDAGSPTTSRWATTRPRDGTTATAHGPACGHPKLGAIDQTDVTGPAHDSYATRHNPFVYFENIIGEPGVLRQPRGHPEAARRGSAPARPPPRTTRGSRRTPAPTPTTPRAARTGPRAA